jgi:hypothetical protein
MIVDVVGWAGAALLLLAYWLVSTRRLRAEGVPFQLVNLGGAGMLAANSAWYGAWPSVALNGAWMAIGLAALVIARSRRRSVAHARSSQA